MNNRGRVHILLVSDGTPATDAAAATVRELLDPSTIDRITIASLGPALTPVNGWVMGMLGLIGAAPPSFSYSPRAQCTTWARTEGDRVARLLGAERCRVVPICVTGDPTDDIVDLARDNNVGLIVIGSSAHQRLSRHDLASELIHRAPCPVLAVRPDADDLPRRGKRSRAARFAPSHPIRPLDATGR
jgi:nucleotide-binding universal stress UspA family protein